MVYISALLPPESNTVSERGRTSSSSPTRAPQSRHKFCKVRSMVTFYSKYTRALTTQNFASRRWQGAAMTPSFVILTQWTSYRKSRLIDPPREGFSKTQWT